MGLKASKSIILIPILIQKEQSLISHKHTCISQVTTDTMNTFKKYYQIMKNIWFIYCKIYYAPILCHNNSEWLTIFKDKTT